MTTNNKRFKCVNIQNTSFKLKNTQVTYNREITYQICCKAGRVLVKDYQKANVLKKDKLCGLLNTSISHSSITMDTMVN